MPNREASRHWKTRPSLKIAKNFGNQRPYCFYPHIMPISFSQTPLHLEAFFMFPLLSYR